MKEQIIRKLTSRRFWLGLAGFIAGLVVMFGYADTDAETISGAILTIGSAVGYMLTEGLVDAKRVGQILEGAEIIFGELKDGANEEAETEETAKDDAE